jgi:hypothetical protein
MAVVESGGYQGACDRIKGNPIISQIAAGGRHRAARRPGSPGRPPASRSCSTPSASSTRPNSGTRVTRPTGRNRPARPRHLGLIAEAILAERAAIRAAVTSAMAAPGTGPESAESGPRMILHNPPGPGAAKNSVHPVLVTDHHDEEIERLTGLGARPLNEIKLPPQALPPGVAAVRQTTFADPEGNEFDLVTWQQQPA